MNRKTNKSGKRMLLAAIAGICSIPFLVLLQQTWTPPIEEDGRKEPVVSPTNIVHKVEQNPSSTSTQTNILWFIDGSRFIWDDWQIK